MYDIQKKILHPKKIIDALDTRNQLVVNNYVNVVQSCVRLIRTIDKTLRRL